LKKVRRSRRKVSPVKRGNIRGPHYVERWKEKPEGRGDLLRGRHAQGVTQKSGWTSAFLQGY